MERTAVAVFCVGGLVLVFLSTTWTVKLKVPAIVALPVMTPLAVSFSPAGNGVEPGARDHL